jgi:hypothetical protein
LLEGDLGGPDQGALALGILDLGLPGFGVGEPVELF